MALVKHNSNINVGDVVGYESYGTVYGARILKSVYIEETGQYHLIVQTGKAVEGGEFKPYSNGRDLVISTKYDLANEYPSRYTPEPKLKDGDLLISKADASGKAHVFVVKGKFNSGAHKLHRISSGYANMFDSQRNYESSYGKLTRVVSDGDSYRPVSL